MTPADIRSERARLDLTQQELADAAGIPRTVLTALEDDKAASAVESALKKLKSRKDARPNHG